MNDPDRLLELARDTAWYVDHARGSADLYYRGVEVPECREVRIWDIHRLASSAWDRMRKFIPDLEAYVRWSDGVKSAARALVREHRETRGVPRGEDAALDALEDALDAPAAASEPRD